MHASVARVVACVAGAAGGARDQAWGGRAWPEAVSGDVFREPLQQAGLHLLRRHEQTAPKESLDHQVPRRGPWVRAAGLRLESRRGGGRRRAVVSPCTLTLRHGALHHLRLYQRPQDMGQ